MTDFMKRLQWAEESLLDMPSCDALYMKKTIIEKIRRELIILEAHNGKRSAVIEKRIEYLFNRFEDEQNTKMVTE